MIFQEPMTSLNPVMTIGRQIAEVLLLHEDMSRADGACARRSRCCAWCASRSRSSGRRNIRISSPGGMRQRAMIAMALACNPKVLIADEPTTALDVTIQAQILEIILDLQRKLGTAVILITHDLGVVAETAQRVIVMYAGRKVEEAPVDELFARPLHPYTHGLMASIPRLGLMRGEAETERRLQEIPGIVPALTNLPAGCVFAPRCPLADDRCRARVSALRGEAARPLGRVLALRRGCTEPASCASTPRHRARGDRPQEAFPDQEGRAAPHGRPCARGRRRALHDPRRRDAGAGRRVRLRQVDGRPHDPAADRADRRAASRSTAPTSRT